MAEVYPIEQVLDKIKEFTPLQRILLASAGTNQSTLSAYFGSPVTIEVTGQQSRKNGGKDLIIRETDLVCNGKTVCSAETTIYACSSVAIDLIEAKELGIGQIMQHLGIKPDFNLEQVGSNDSGFWRIYTLTGDDSCLTYRIHEQFPHELYRE